MQFVWVALTAFVAYGTGKRVWLWALGAYFFGWVPLLLALLVPGKQEVIDRRMAYLNMMTGEQLNQAQSAIIKKEMKDFDTVDDLFKQLEKN